MTPWNVLVLFVWFLELDILYPLLKNTDYFSRMQYVCILYCLHDRSAFGAAELKVPMTGTCHVACGACYRDKQSSILNLWFTMSWCDLLCFRLLRLSWRTIGQLRCRSSCTGSHERGRRYCQQPPKSTIALQFLLQIAHLWQGKSIQSYGCVYAEGS